MPTTYAHWRFGCDCIETLPENLKKIVHDHREIFDFGVHGPDIFFYDLRHPDIPKYGSKMHHEPARIFFNRCTEVYKFNDKDKEAMLSYILGFLSHYALDSQCHCYINTKDKKTPGLSHNKIEAEYDGHMMRLDCKAVSQTNRAESLKPNKDIAEVISRFFPLTDKEVLRSIKGQKLIISALNCKTNLKRKTVAQILRRFNKNDYADLIVQTKELDICKDSNLRIDKLRENAIKVYPKLVNSFMETINNNSPLSSYFERDFDPEADESLPVLSYEEELQYKPVFE